MFTEKKWKSGNHVPHSLPGSNQMELNAAVSFSCGLWAPVYHSLPLSLSRPAPLQIYIFLSDPYKAYDFWPLDWTQIYWKCRISESFEIHESMKVESLRRKSGLKNASRQLNWEAELAFLGWTPLTLYEKAQLIKAKLKLVCCAFN